MKSVKKSILYRSVFSTYNKLSMKLLRFFYKYERLRNYLNIYVKCLSTINPDIKTFFSIHQIVDFKNYEGVKSINEFSRILYAAKPQYYFSSFMLENIDEHKTTLLVLPDVEIIGGSNLIKCDDYFVLNDSFHFNAKDNIATSDQAALIQLDNFIISRFKKSPERIEKGILLSGNVSGNFYHFIYEILSRFFILDKFNIDPQIPLIVDEVAFIVPQFGELISSFNSDKRDIVYVKSGFQYDVNHLYYFHNVSFIPLNFIDFNKAKYTDCLYDLEALQYIRMKMLSMKSNNQFSRKIFLARKHASKRRTYNEHEVSSLLARYGFETVYPERFSIADQISIFNGAEIIVGATGAALSNIICCHEKCSILCLTPSHLDISVFSTIAKYVGADLQYVSAKGPDYISLNAHESFHVDLVQFEKTLIDWLSTSSGQDQEELSAMH